MPESVVTLLRDVKRLVDSEDLWLAHITDGQSSRAVWEKLSRLMGRSAAVYPVLMDSDGVAHYPTGEVTLRFEKTPTPDEVMDFARAHGLRLLRGNEFAPQQFVFAPLDSVADFLPDLISRLARSAGVSSAWANTLSRYRRQQ